MLNEEKSKGYPKYHKGFLCIDSSSQPKDWIRISRVSCTGNKIHYYWAITNQGSNRVSCIGSVVLATGPPGKSNVLFILHFFFFYVDKSFKK